MKPVTTDQVKKEISLMRPGLGIQNPFHEHSTGIASRQPEARAFVISVSKTFTMRIAPTAAPSHYLLQPHESLQSNKYATANSLRKDSCRNNHGKPMCRPPLQYLGQQKNPRRHSRADNNQSEFFSEDPKI